MVFFGQSVLSRSLNTYIHTKLTILFNELFCHLVWGPKDWKGYPSFSQLLIIFAYKTLTCFLTTKWLIVKMYDKWQCTASIQRERALSHIWQLAGWPFGFIWVDVQYHFFHVTKRLFLVNCPSCAFHGVRETANMRLCDLGVYHHGFYPCSIMPLNQWTQSAVMPSATMDLNHNQG